MTEADYAAANSTRRDSWPNFQIFFQIQRIRPTGLTAPASEGPVTKTGTLLRPNLVGGVWEGGFEPGERGTSRMEALA